MSQLSQPGTPPLPLIAVAMSGIDSGVPALSALAPGGERVRALLAWLSASGARGVRVDATMAGIRPRELDRSGRRDLGAILRRTELAFAGVDLFIPPEHFVKPDTADRAVSGVLGAVDLAADLSGLAFGAIVTRLASGTPTSVSVVLPPKLPPDIRAAIADHAASRNVRVANQAWPIEDQSPLHEHTLGIGLDPATVLAFGADPVALAATLGSRLACARLSDIAGAAVIGGGRVPPGSGRLDALAYLATLTTVGYQGFVVQDLHGLRDPTAAIKLFMA